MPLVDRLTAILIEAIVFKEADFLIDLWAQSIDNLVDLTGNQESSAMDQRTLTKNQALDLFGLCLVFVLWFVFEQGSSFVRIKTAQAQQDRG